MLNILNRNRPTVEQLTNEWVAIARSCLLDQQREAFKRFAIERSLSVEIQQAIIDAVSAPQEAPLGEDVAIETALTDETHLQGYRIAQVATSFGLPIEYQPAVSSRALRVTRLRFTPRGETCNVSKIDGLRPNFVAHGGLDPEFISLIIPGFVEIQTPLPSHMWQFVGWRSFLKDGHRQFFKNGKLVGQSSPPEHGFSYVLGADLDGRALWLKNVVGLLITGIKGSGKSDHTVSMLLQLMVQYQPKHYKFFLVDAPGATFFGLQGSPWEWCPAVVGDYPELFKERISKVQEEAKRREVLFRENGVSCIEGWNRKHPSNPLCRIGVVVEEFEETCERFGKDLVNSYLAALSRANRKQGIDVIVTTQVAKKDLFAPGLINNLGDRVSFKTADRYGSEMAVGQTGSEMLLGKGDGFARIGSIAQRFQSLYLGEDEELQALMLAIMKKGYESYGAPGHKEFNALSNADPLRQDADRELWDRYQSAKVRWEQGGESKYAVIEQEFGATKGRKTQELFDRISVLERRFGSPDRDHTTSENSSKPNIKSTY